MKEKATKKNSESSTVNAEVTLCDIELIDGTFSGEFSTMATDASFDILHRLDIWICDTGASCHLTNSIAGSTNVRSCGSNSIALAGKAMRSMKTIDIPGQFVKSEWASGIEGNPH